MVDLTGCPDNGTSSRRNPLKVYCCNCRHARTKSIPGAYYCKTVIITGPGKDTWWAPGKEETTTIESICSEKNKYNDCPDFQKKCAYTGEA